MKILGCYFGENDLKLNFNKNVGKNEKYNPKVGTYEIKFNCKECFKKKQLFLILFLIELCSSLSKTFSLSNDINVAFKLFCLIE